jgi:1,4-alpha-glucan branching enzyme
MALVTVLLVRVSAGPRAVPTVAVAVAPAAVVPDKPVRVRFQLQARGARRVALAGSFNQWRPDDIVLDRSSGDGVFVGTLELPPGDYEYMFVVDGKWMTDPAAGERRDDGFGRQNSLLRL